MDYNQRNQDGFEEQIVQVSRVSKKTKGGNKIGFSVLLVVGNRQGKVGVGLGKGGDVALAIKKGSALARKHAIEVPIINGTIPFEFYIKLGAAKVLLKPAPTGSGVIAGGAVRSVVSLAGISNISSKVLGTGNKASNVYATIEALKRLAVRYKREGDRRIRNHESK
ncbi:MAG: 30S ribosomal protein S5 [Candidatus Levybacteria bacterium]|nr:30S ribosomal protein S5 [Candidatus Levybacteria bacterium]